ncbi:MAG: metal ABC transporter permease [Sulfuricurvum sp.]
MSTIELLWPVLVLALSAVAIHAVFGLEILRRGVIFTDLAVGQIAAVGIAVGSAFFAGEYGEWLSFVFSLGAALLIAVASQRSSHIEAFIGLMYALGASAVMIVLSQGSEGDELFKRLMANDILFVTTDEIVRSILIYALIAVSYFWVYPRLSGFWRELFFFSLLSVTVGVSVPLMGVLVVFALLIAPAYAAAVQKRFVPLPFATLYGWSFVSVALLLSYRFDWPTGYSIVFVGTLLTLGTVMILEKKPHE